MGTFSFTWTTTGTTIHDLPLSVSRLTITCWAGGGAGGRRTTAGGGGGGGGGACSVFYRDTYPAVKLDIIVGSGGNGNGLGSIDGGDSVVTTPVGMSYVVLCSADGGNGCSLNSATGQTGGDSAAGTGDFLYSGGKGGKNNSNGGGGGGGGAGDANKGNDAGTGATPGPGGVYNINGSGGSGRTGTEGSGENGKAYGGGGGGGYRISNNVNGGNGGGGSVRIEYTYTDNLLLNLIS